MWVSLFSNGKWALPSANQTLKLHRDSIVLFFFFWLIHENTSLCDTRENFARNLTNFFHLKTSKGSFYFIQWISIHTKVAWNLDRGISPPRKISWETGDVPEWGSQTEIKFHDGSHFGTLIRGLTKVMQARNYLDYNWGALGYPLLFSCLAEQGGW